tara:strand:+ start:1008 stop:1469 length:462 start_codon:yes stop_codon:yes gene_type:complete
MSFSNFFQGKNLIASILGVLLLVYLYFDTPLPFLIILKSYSLFLVSLLSLVIFCYLMKNLNIFVAIIFAIVAFEVIKKSTIIGDLNNVSKELQYYDNSKSFSNIVISERLKDSDTLEQEIVKNMVPISQPHFIPESPRYQALLPDLAGTSQVD